MPGPLYDYHVFIPHYVSRMKTRPLSFSPGANPMSKAASNPAWRTKNIIGYQVIMTDILFLLMQLAILSGLPRVF